MARTKTEVLVGAGTLYTAPVGEAFPADPQTAVAGQWEDIGYSEDGWAFAADFTVEDVVVAEEVDPLFVFKTGQNLRFLGTIAQASLANFAVAMGGGTITPTVGPPALDTYAPPAADVYNAKALLFRTKAPGFVSGTNEIYRDIQIQEAVNVGAFEMRHSKAPAIASIGIEFRILVPATGDTFNVVDTTSLT